MQIISFYKKKKKEKGGAIWKLLGKLSCFVGNILVRIKDVSTFIYIYIYIF